MTNKAIAQKFDDLANIMELHGENPYKIRSYQNAHVLLRKLSQSVAEMTHAELVAMKGIGKAIAEKVQELLATGELRAYHQYAEKTPVGVRDMLHIKGFGPKKVKVVWEELGVESMGELLYACLENRLIALKGFGEKTQAALIEQINYLEQAKGKYLYATLDKEWERLRPLLEAALPDEHFELAGEMRRRCIVLERIDILTTASDLQVLFDEKLFVEQTMSGGAVFAKTKGGFPVVLRQCGREALGSKLFLHTGPKDFLDLFLALASSDNFKQLPNEEQLFEKANLPYVVPELRDSTYVRAYLNSVRPYPDFVNANTNNKLVELSDVQGILHTHTTHSDGIHTIEEMARHAQTLGYAYLGITDHSKSAFYANGLQEERVRAQWDEINSLNKQFTDFAILKGIEADILPDGRLDYGDDLLQGFDFVIASVHSHLKMDEVKATQRLIKAIEHPCTNILGHPTGRLLLARRGYPIDHERVIDACAANSVAIELNANPHRLDLDHEWLPYAMQRNVMVAINPDAHTREAMGDLRYGVFAARKGGLTKGACLSCLGLSDLLAFFRK
jgi:DNA polymerase (family 10)